MHTDPELLSLLALGEEAGTDEDRSHLQTCQICADELKELQHLVSLGRGVGSDTGFAVPRPHVWARISDELALQPAREDTPGHPSLLPMMEAALVGSSRGSAELVARATLVSVPTGRSGSGSGEAVIATDELGRRILQVALEADLPDTGFRQAWLIHRDDPARKQTLGILDGRYGVWTVDKSIDLEQYAILDISQQRASETEHSGHTIVRGQLTVVS
jgi:hypothetical protein